MKGFPKRLTMVPVNIDFQYLTEGRKLPLPSWVKFYLQLGAVVAQENSVELNGVTALAVPTRPYAAVLVAAGVVVSKATKIGTKRQDSPTSHFEMLASLPRGTSVTVRKGAKLVKGVLVGASDLHSDGKVRIGIRIQSGKGGALTEWLPPDSSPNVQVSTKNWSRLPTDADKAKHVDASVSEFISQVFQGADLGNFVTESTLDCVIVGNLGQLVQEALALKLSVGLQGTEESGGTLRDLLRIRRLCGKSEAFRSDIFPVRTRKNVTLTDGMEPDLVIFDGAYGFLKWRYEWPRCNWVVILDRTDPHFTEAVQLVNEDYLSRISDEKLSVADPPPQSVELVTFTLAK